MREFPELVYGQSQAHAYMWMEQESPEIFRAIRKRVRQKRWEITGGMWSESDTNVPGGESLVRQFLYGKRYFMKKFGVDVKVGWLPDTFGYNWNMPQILKKAGCDYFVGTKLNSNDTNRFPHVVFWWQAPDGSRVLAYHPVKGYGGEVTQRGLSRHMGEHLRRSGLTNFMELYGRGDHGGGPSREDLQEARRLAESPAFPRVKHGTALEWLKEHESIPDLPVWNDEMYLEYHRGTYTTQSNNKKGNRRSEVLMHAAETFSSWAHVEGYAKYPIRKLNKTWQTILFNQFHDILPGSSIPEVYVDSAKDYAEIFKSGELVLSKALKAISARVNTEGEGTPVVVFNPLSWMRTDLVEIDAPSRLRKRGKALCALDAGGRRAPVQVIGKSGGKIRLLFVAESVPSMGYKVFWLQPCEPGVYADAPSASTAGMENGFFRLTFDQETGSCSSIFDKRNNREVLDGKGLGFDLQVFADDGNAWDILLRYKQNPLGLDPGAKIELVEQGPVRSVVRATRTMGSSTMQRNYILYRDIPRVDCVMDVDWHPKHVLLKAAFPLSITAPRATYEIPYAIIERSTGEETPFEAAKFEACAQKWVDVTRDGYGVSLLNNPKYGHDIKGNLMRITLLRAPTSPDPEADMGRHNFSIALYPHAGDWRAAETVRRAYEFNHPLLARLENQHAGALSAEMGFAGISPGNVILSAVKKAEDSDELVLRWYEAHGESVDAQVTLPKEANAACETDLLEREINGSQVTLSGRALTLATGPYEIKTVRVRF
jgi:alpha-mannosidase